MRGKQIDWLVGWSIIELWTEPTWVVLLVVSAPLRYQHIQCGVISLDVLPIKQLDVNYLRWDVYIGKSDVTAIYGIGMISML